MTKWCSPDYLSSMYNKMHRNQKKKNSSLLKKVLTTAATLSGAALTGLLLAEAGMWISTKYTPAEGFVTQQIPLDTTPDTSLDADPPVTPNDTVDFFIDD
jgi:hypothetical protein